MGGNKTIVVRLLLLFDDFPPRHSELISEFHQQQVALFQLQIVHVFSVLEFGLEVAQSLVQMRFKEG